MTKLLPLSEASSHLRYSAGLGCEKSSEVCPGPAWTVSLTLVYDKGNVRKGKGLSVAQHSLSKVVDVVA